MYRDLLDAFIQEGYAFQTYREYIINPAKKVVILRHDVDDRKQHSFQFAQIQNTLGIRGTYYFRVVSESYDAILMKQMEEMGHEIGLHYEEMDFTNGNIEAAYQLFLEHLALFRSVVEVNTICMHGSPRSSYDNKDIWNSNDYKSLGLIGEPYFDLDTEKVFYVTDTGMMWDGNKYSIRDKMSNVSFKKKYHSTHEIIADIRNGNFPKQCMMNFHPQRWHDNDWNWMIEKVKQSAKNVVKRVLLMVKS